jgi:hypothetical protein
MKQHRPYGGVVNLKGTGFSGMPISLTVLHRRPQADWQSKKRYDGADADLQFHARDKLKPGIGLPTMPANGFWASTGSNCSGNTE